MDPVRAVIFQLFSHKHLYAEGNVTEAHEDVRDGRPIWRGHRVFRPAPSVRRPRVAEEATEEAEEEEEGEVPTINLWSALILLVIVTVLVACALYLNFPLMNLYADFANS